MNHIGLGRIDNPSAYLDDDKNIFISDSIKAYQFFYDKTNKDGIVTQAVVEISQEKEFHVPCWMYVVSGDFESCAIAPIFCCHHDLFKDEIIFTSIENILDDGFIFVCHEEFYKSFATSTGELVVKKMKYFLDEAEIRLIMEGQDIECEEIALINFYHKTTGEYCTCWAVKEFGNNVVSCYPLFPEQVNASKINDFDNTVEKVLNVGDIITFDNKVYVVSLNIESGKVLKELNISPEQCTGLLFTNATSKFKS